MGSEVRRRDEAGGAGDFGGGGGGSDAKVFREVLQPVWLEMAQTQKGLLAMVLKMEKTEQQVRFLAEDACSLVQRVRALKRRFRAVERRLDACAHDHNVPPERPSSASSLEEPSSKLSSSRRRVLAATHRKVAFIRAALEGSSSASVALGDPHSVPDVSSDDSASGPSLSTASSSSIASSFTVMRISASAPVGHAVARARSFINDGEFVRRRNEKRSRDETEVETNVSKATPGSKQKTSCGITRSVSCENAPTSIALSKRLDRSDSRLQTLFRRASLLSSDASVTCPSTTCSSYSEQCCSGDNFCVDCRMGKETTASDSELLLDSSSAETGLSSPSWTTMSSGCSRARHAPSYHCAPLAEMPPPEQVGVCMLPDECCVHIQAFGCNVVPSPCCLCNNEAYFAQTMAFPSTSSFPHPPSHADSSNFSLASDAVFFSHSWFPGRLECRSESAMSVQAPQFGTIITNDSIGLGNCLCNCMKPSRPAGLCRSLSGFYGVYDRRRPDDDLGENENPSYETGQSTTSSSSSVILFSTVPSRPVQRVVCKTMKKSCDYRRSTKAPLKKDCGKRRREKKTPKKYSPPMSGSKGRANCKKIRTRSGIGRNGRKGVYKFIGRLKADSRHSSKYSSSSDNYTMFLSSLSERSHPIVPRTLSTLKNSKKPSEINNSSKEIGNDADREISVCSSVCRERGPGTPGKNANQRVESTRLGTSYSLTDLSHEELTKESFASKLLKAARKGSVLEVLEMLNMVGAFNDERTSRTSPSPSSGKDKSPLKIHCKRHVGGSAGDNERGKDISSESDNTSSSKEPTPAFTETAAQTVPNQNVLGRKLLKAVQVGDIAEVKNLLKERVDVNFSNNWDWTSLHWAAIKGHPKIVSLLLKRGADILHRTTCGNTALHMAACGPSKRCVCLLLRAGSGVDAWNQFGRTPLHLAASCGNAIAVKLLVAAGASKTLKDRLGRTPFHVAKTPSTRRLLHY